MQTKDIDRTRDRPGTVPSFCLLLTRNNVVDDPAVARGAVPPRVALAPRTAIIAQRRRVRNIEDLRNPLPTDLILMDFRAQVTDAYDATRQNEADLTCNGMDHRAEKDLADDIRQYPGGAR